MERLVRGRGQDAVGDEAILGVELHPPVSLSSSFFFFLQPLACASALVPRQRPIVNPALGWKVWAGCDRRRCVCSFSTVSDERGALALRAWVNLLRDAPSHAGTLDWLRGGAAAALAAALARVLLSGWWLGDVFTAPLPCLIRICSTSEAGSETFSC